MRYADLEAAAYWLYGGDIDFDNVTQVSEEAAKLIANCGDLSVPSLSELPDEIADVFGGAHGRLDLSGLTELSNAAAQVPC